MNVPDSITALVVDDDPALRLLVRKALVSFGCTEILEAADGQQAIDLLQGGRAIDLVVTDVLMPGLDGFALLRWAQEHRPEPVWVILSGLDTFETAVEAIRLGAFDFLPKPPRAKELEVAIRNGLEHRRLVREKQRLDVELQDAHQQLLEKVMELETKSELLRRDLERAEIIQRALLPRVLPRIEHYSIHALYRPGSHVGGDLYDVVRLDDRRVALYVADATGHGVSAAMLSVLFKQRLLLVDGETGKPLTPSAVLSAVNRSLTADAITPGLFLTAAYCLLDTETGDVTIASAGHPPLVHAPAGSAPRFVRRTGPALGLIPEARFLEQRLHLDSGDRLLLFTDGLLRHHDSSLEYERLSRQLHVGSPDADRLLQTLLRAPQQQSDDERDDVTLVLLEARPGPCRFDNGDSSRTLQRTPLATAEKPVVYYGESEESSRFALRGRGTWTQCDAFHGVACSILDEGHALDVDLADCEYLDSTFLGTLHELVGRAAGSGRRRFRLINVPTPIRQVFEELSMDQVLSSIDASAPLVSVEMLPLAVPAPEDARGRILHAHEALASLSVRNRSQFLGVVESLRTGVQAGRGGPS